MKSRSNEQTGTGRAPRESGHNVPPFRRRVFIWPSSWGILLAALTGCALPGSLGESGPPAPNEEFSRPPMPIFGEEGRGGAPGAASAPVPATPSRSAGASRPERAAARTSEQEPVPSSLTPQVAPLGGRPAAVRTAPMGALPGSLSAGAAAGATPRAQATNSDRREPFSEGSADPGGLNTRPTRIRGTESDPLEDIFRGCLERYRAANSRPTEDDYAVVERGELEAKLIALFFLRDQRNLEEYRDLIRSHREGDSAPVELDLLRAALYQKIGQPDLRDRALSRLRTSVLAGEKEFRLAQAAFAREIRGYRNFTRIETAKFTAGEEILLYGEFEGFKNSPAAQAGSAAGHRRSFAAQIVLKGQDGEEIDRRDLLRAGQAVEVVVDPEKPVHFWGRYPVPRDARPGEYLLDIEASDLEGRQKAHARLPLTVR